MTLLLHSGFFFFQSRNARRFTVASCSETLKLHWRSKFQHFDYTAGIGPAPRPHSAQNFNEKKTLIPKFQREKNPNSQISQIHRNPSLSSAASTVCIRLRLRASNRFITKPSSRHHLASQPPSPSSSAAFPFFLGRRICFCCLLLTNAVARQPLLVQTPSPASPFFLSRRRRRCICLLLLLRCRCICLTAFTCKKSATGNWLPQDLNKGISHQKGNDNSKKRRLTSEQVQFLERSFEVENKLEPERKVQEIFTEVEMDEVITFVYHHGGALVTKDDGEVVYELGDITEQANEEATKPRAEVS
ncbi:hypothetical protein PIB30_058335 [Stylosanthes scabra]|uniref:Homeobox-leucine zipper protein n=1 Tax=Stylosanthes scabra TaxID=79078 RepID=A0ABU6YL53_9FABA|nr:hypothetical protein [Stylosanthes scabra]